MITNHQPLKSKLQRPMCALTLAEKMKKHRKHIILAITLLIVWRLWPATLIFTGLNLRVETDFSRINEAIPPQEEPKEVQKMCGGFHADYYLKWKTDSDTWEILLCMGCHEAIIFHDGLSLRCDLASDAAKRIKTVIKNGG